MRHKIIIMSSRSSLLLFSAESVVELTDSWLRLVSEWAETDTTRLTRLRLGRVFEPWLDLDSFSVNYFVSFSFPIILDQLIYLLQCAIVKHLSFFVAHTFFLVPYLFFYWPHVRKMSVQILKNSKLSFLQLLVSLKRLWCHLLDCMWNRIVPCRWMDIRIPVQHVEF